MRVNDRAIRDELRRQATSVPIPDDMWANIDRELKAAKAPAQPPVVAQAPPYSRSMQLRQMLAIAAAAGIFWLMVIPSSAYVDRLNEPEPAPAAAPAAPAPAKATPNSISWDVRIDPRQKDIPPSFRVVHDARRPAPEIAIIR